MQVIKESGEIALSWVVAHASRLGLPHDVLNARGIDMHLHLPRGAQKKAGPSAGVAIVSDSSARIYDAFR